MLPANMPVDEFTTPDPITVTEDMNIEELNTLMSEHAIRHLPVLRDGVAVGVISDRDVRLCAGLSLAEKFQVSAGDIMSPEPLTVSSTTALDEVAFLMSENKIGSVIVLEDGQFLGIFTATDALNALIEIIRSMPQSCSGS